MVPRDLLHALDELGVGLFPNDHLDLLESGEQPRADDVDLGSSGMKFEVEGGEGSAGADTYIPLDFLPSFFTENCDFAAIF